MKEQFWSAASHPGFQLQIFLPHLHTQACKKQPSSAGSMWARSLLRCQQVNEQQCLPNGSVVQHAGLLKQHLIRGWVAVPWEINCFVLHFFLFNIPRCFRIFCDCKGATYSYYRKVREMVGGAGNTLRAPPPRHRPTACLPGSVFSVLSWPWETDSIPHGSAARMQVDTVNRWHE